MVTEFKPYDQEKQNPKYHTTGINAAIKEMWLEFHKCCNDDTGIQQGMSWYASAHNVDERDLRNRWDAIEMGYRDFE
jgi:hypothetical protein